MIKILLAAAAVALLALPASAAKKAKAAAETLAPGRYTAKVKMLACEACGPAAEKALKAVKGVDAAAVDAKTSTIEFAVKDPVKVADLQKALKAASDEMGMGADYSLSKIKELKSAPKG